MRNWEELKDEIKKHQEKGDTGKDKTISVLSWRKFYRLFRKTLERNKDLFSNSINEQKSEVRLQDSIKQIKKNDIHVIDIAKLDEESQGFVFGDVMRAIYDLKLGQITDREESEIPSKIVIFIDELNKYGSKDVPKNSPILRQLLDIKDISQPLKQQVDDIQIINELELEIDRINTQIKRSIQTNKKQELARKRYIIEQKLAKLKGE